MYSTYEKLDENQNNKRNFKIFKPTQNHKKVIKTISSTQIEELFEDKNMKMMIDYIQVATSPRFFPIIHYDPLCDLPVSTHKRNSLNLRFFILICFSSLFNIISSLVANKILKKYSFLELFSFTFLQAITFILFSHKFLYLSLYISSLVNAVPTYWKTLAICCIAWFFSVFLGTFLHIQSGLITLSKIISKSDFSLCDVVIIMNIIFSFLTIYSGFLVIKEIENPEEKEGFIEL